MGVDSWSTKNLQGDNESKPLCQYYLNEITLIKRSYLYKRYEMWKCMLLEENLFLWNIQSGRI